MCTYTSKIELKNPKKQGFTIIELMVAIAIIGLLISLLLPAVQRARASARRTQCQNNLKQLSLALHNYESKHTIFPPGAIVFGPAFVTAGGWGWGAQILPHIEEKNIYDQIDFETNNAVGSNRDVIKKRILSFVCPSNVQPNTVEIPIPTEPTPTVATGNYVGSAPVLGPASAVRMRDITDGTHETLLLGERLFVPKQGFGLASTSSWCGIVSGQNSYVFDSVPYLSPSNMTKIAEGGFYSEHSGGANFSFLDGHAKFLTEGIDDNVFEALGTISGGEVIGEF